MTESPIFLSFIIIFYVIGLLCACSAILRSRTPQGAAAWVMALISFPFASVPFFLIFGRTKFQGYNSKRRLMDAKVMDHFDSLRAMNPDLFPSSDEFRLINATISSRNQPGFTRKNKIKLLSNGPETYSGMLADLENAKEYIIFQFYIFRGDDIGSRFADVLIRKSVAGVKVTFLHDDIGNKVPDDILIRMEEAGIKIGPFNDKNYKGSLQINFRNHRKIIVIDGKVGFVGGLNIGDDYLGRWKKYGPWRDSHVRLEGPAVIAAQLASAKDWFFTNESPIEAKWEAHPSDGDSHVMVLHTGPADERQTCLLAHIALINSATKRLWIANPYFVPPESLMDAVLLAILRGVDVRILVPGYSDARLVFSASKIYQERLIDHGAKVFRYTEGFMHQKVMLVDDAFASIGSVNFDFRSMFINFEITTISSDPQLIRDLMMMLERDFLLSEHVKKDEFTELDLFTKIKIRGANLLAPVL